MKISVLLLLIYFLCCFNEYSTAAEEKTKFSSTRRQTKHPRRTAPILLYKNHDATFQLLLSGDIQVNPGPDSCSSCDKTVRKNSWKYRCTICRDSTHAKCIGKKFVKNRSHVKTINWTCHRCLLFELPFHKTRTINEDIPPVDNVLDEIENEHLTAMESNKSKISIAHLNTQSIASTFAEFEHMLMRFNFDIITLSETWLKDNPILLDHVNIPGYKTEFKHRDQKRGGGVGLYIRGNIRYKLRKDIMELLIIYGWK